MTDRRKKINIKRHPMRIFDRFIEFFDIGESCECVISYEHDPFYKIGIFRSIFSRWGGGSTCGGGCRQRNILNGYNTTMNQHGDGKFLCNWCSKNHKKENIEWRKERLKFLKNLDPQTKLLYETNRNKFL